MLKYFAQYVATYAFIRSSQVQLVEMVRDAVLFLGGSLGVDFGNVLSGL